VRLNVLLGYRRALLRIIYRIEGREVLLLWLAV
jgi:hypothetical protein